jgi:hypothetical protein
MSLKRFAENTDFRHPEVYVVLENYGCAVYTAQLFERGLQNVITGLERLGALTLPPETSRSGDGFVETCLGPMLRVLESQSQMDREMSRLLKKAHYHRNTLVHRFLAENAVDLLNAAGCAKVNQKLEHIYNTVRRANAVVAQISEQIFAQFGFDPAEMNRRIEELRRVAEDPQIDLDDQDA